jgi:hypothetical protein
VYSFGTRFFSEWTTEEAIIILIQRHPTVPMGLQTVEDSITKEEEEDLRTMQALEALEVPVAHQR